MKKLIFAQALVRYKSSFKTLKSRYDQQNNQDLLKRMQNLSVIGQKKTVDKSEASDVVYKGSRNLPARNLEVETLKKLLRFYHSDPLLWNPSVLGRIFNMPENYCEKILDYVKPMVYYANNKHDQAQQLMKTSYVVDIGRMKSDTNYLTTYKKLVFPEISNE